MLGSWIPSVAALRVGQATRRIIVASAPLLESDELREGPAPVKVAMSAGAKWL